MAKNTKFDLDLEYGQIREKRIENLLKGGKIEVKTERSWWRKTGNIAIEYSFDKTLEENNTIPLFKYE